VIPVTVCRSFGPDIVIAVDVNAAGATFFGSTGSVIGVLLQSMLVVQKTSSHYQLAAADLVITPEVAHIRWDEMRRADELMDAGYAAALESVPEILALIETRSVKSAIL
jgi:NTE family protein